MSDLATGPQALIQVLNEEVLLEPPNSVGSSTILPLAQPQAKEITIIEGRENDKSDIDSRD